MPLYEFQCPKCGDRFERIQRFSDPDPKKCPKCGAGKIERLLHAPAVQFKGSGWYVTDYAKRSSASHSESKSESTGEAKADSKADDSKPKVDQKKSKK